MRGRSDSASFIMEMSPVDSSTWASTNMCNLGLFQHIPRNASIEAEADLNMKRCPGWNALSAIAFANTCTNFEIAPIMFDLSHNPPHVAWQMFSMFGTSSLSPLSCWSPSAGWSALERLKGRWKRSFTFWKHSGSTVSMSISLCFSAPVP